MFDWFLLEINFNGRISVHCFYWMEEGAADFLARMANLIWSKDLFVWGENIQYINLQIFLVVFVAVIERSWEAQLEKVHKTKESNELRNYLEDPKVGE